MPAVFCYCYCCVGWFGPCCSGPACVWLYPVLNLKEVIALLWLKSGWEQQQIDWVGARTEQNTRQITEKWQILKPLQSVPVLPLE